MIQALTTHIEQLCALPDELCQNTISRYRRLCAQCGCHTERELAEYLQESRTPLRCPIARLLRACGQLGVQIRLPAVLSLGKVQRELSWHGLPSPRPGLSRRGGGTAAGRCCNARGLVDHHSALPAASRDSLPPDDGGESTPPPGAVACANYHPTESRLAGTAAESPSHG
jgi:hypothetical protein